MVNSVSFLSTKFKAVSSTNLSILCSFMALVNTDFHCAVQVNNFDPKYNLYEP
jgi:hypothetical protein